VAFVHPAALVLFRHWRDVTRGGTIGARAGDEGRLRSKEGVRMPVVQANGIDVYYEVQGAPIYENVAVFNERTLGFLHRHSG
jgi:hypothetical protein